MITIQGAGEQHLAVGGGAGKYIVYATFDSQNFWNLIQPDSATGTVMLNTGGQEGDFPAKQIVSKKQARAAAIAFFERGELDPGQQWSQD